MENVYLAIPSAQHVMDILILNAIVVMITQLLDLDTTSLTIHVLKPARMDTTLITLTRAANHANQSVRPVLHMTFAPAASMVLINLITENALILLVLIRSTEQLGQYYHVTTVTRHAKHVKVLQNLIV